MTKGIRCAIIGAGVIGSAAAYALARRGADVELFDQFNLFHTRGSSHGATRMLRIAYYEHPDYAPLMRRATSLWRDLEAASYQTLFHQSGVFMAGYENGALIPGVLKAADQHGLLLEHISVEEAARQCEWLSFPKGIKIIREPEAGIIFADKAIAALLSCATENGAKVRGQSIVLNWEPTPDGIVVRTQNGAERFDRMIITTGAWANDLLGDIGAPITPISKNLFWLSPQDRRFSLESGYSAFAIETEDMRFYYGFPAIDRDGVKIAEHTGGYSLTHATDEPPETFQAEDSRNLQTFLSRFAPKLRRNFSKAQKCLYEASPDRHFIVDHHPADARICFAAGLSGHGFKFAPVLGEVLADLASDKDLPPEIRFLSLERFQST
jgi:sarcosine oxidase